MPAVTLILLAILVAILFFGWLINGHLLRIAGLLDAIGSTTGRVGAEVEKLRETVEQSRKS